MTPLLCAYTRCRVIARHTTGCADPATCSGCQPARAADGLRLCWHHTHGIGRDATAAAQRWADLGQVLAAAGSAGEATSGSRDPGLKLDPRALALRTEIRHTLVAIARYIGEERGIALPTDDVSAIADYVAAHREWLAAGPAAEDTAAELHELAHGEAYRVAYPSGTRVVTIAGCPVVVDGQRCPGEVRAILRRTDSMLPSVLACSADAAHQWPASQWRAFSRQTGQAVA